MAFSTKEESWIAATLIIFLTVFDLRWFFKHFVNQIPRDGVLNYISNIGGKK